MAEYHWRKVVLVYQAWGCTVRRQRGSHIMLSRPDLLRPVVIPKKKNLQEGIIQSNLRTLGRTKAEFLKEYRSL